MGATAFHLRSHQRTERLFRLTGKRTNDFKGEQLARISGEADVKRCASNDANHPVSVRLSSMMLPSGRLSSVGTPTSLSLIGEDPINCLRGGRFAAGRRFPARRSRAAGSRCAGPVGRT